MGRNLGPLNIKDSYEGLVQISGSSRDTLTDGSGSVITNLDVNATTATSASYAVNSDTAISSSYALTASFAENSTSNTLAEVLTAGNTTLGGQSIIISGSGLITRTFNGDGITSGIAGGEYIIKAGSVNARLVLQGNGANDNIIKLDSTGVKISGSVDSQNNIAAPLFIGDLQGNADTATSASHAVNADNAISSSYAVTASYAENASVATLQEVLNAGNEAQSDMILTGSLKLGDGGTHYNAINIETFDGANTITGDSNSVGTIAIGQGNTTGKAASISIGKDNINTAFANGDNNVIIGLGNDISSGNFTSRNYIFGTNLSITGDGNYRVLLGGNNNLSSGGGYSSILAGQNNTDSGESSAIIAGTGNNNTQLRAVILGGESNTINGGQGGIVAGGINNVVGHSYSVVLGGTSLATTKANEVVVPHLNISGSLTDSDGNIGTVGQVLTSNGTDKVQWDTAAGGAAFPYTGSAEITGSLGLTGSLSQGETNSNLGTNTAILSSGDSLISASVSEAVIIASTGSYQSTTQPGRTAIIASDNSYINSTSAGNNDDIALIGTLNSRFTGGGARQAVIAGTNNCYNNGSRFSFIGGGENHIMSGFYANAIVGGNGNRMLLGTNSAIAGGNGNRIGNTTQADFGFVGGGRNNYLDGDNSAIIAGTNGDNDHDRSVILGGASLATNKNDEVVVPSLDINGTVVQNVQALTITSNTASLDATTGQMFTLGLQNGVDTRLELSNQVAGQTFSLKITNNATAAGTISFDSQFEFEGGTTFTATAATNAVDILTFTTFDGTNVQCVGSKNFS